jgi:hypothetical protein
MFMLLAGGLFTMTSFYGIFFVYLFRAGLPAARRSPTY